MQVKSLLSHFKFVLVFRGLPFKIFSIYLEAGQVVPESTRSLGQLVLGSTRPGQLVLFLFAWETLHALTNIYLYQACRQNFGNKNGTYFCECSMFRLAYASYYILVSLSKDKDPH